MNPLSDMYINPLARFTKDGEVYSALQDVLVAFSIYRPEIGYCQGLNYIAGILLLGKIPMLYV